MLPSSSLPRTGKASASPPTVCAHWAAQRPVVRGIKTDATVVFAGIPADDDVLLLATTKGMGKRIDPADLPEQNRGGKGVRVLPAGKWGTLHTGALTSGSDVQVLDTADSTALIAVSVGAFPQTARDAKPGKIRGHNATIDRIVG